MNLFKVLIKWQKGLFLNVYSLQDLPRMGF